MTSLLRGALAGTLATVPMTAFMMSLQRALPPGQRYALPPRQVTEEAAERAGFLDELSEPGLDALTMLAHFGIGAAMGGLYGLAEGRLPGPPVAKGALFGLAVWTGGYVGALPALGILAPVKEHPDERRRLMIAAHVIFGSALGILTDRLEG